MKYGQLLNFRACTDTRLPDSAVYFLINSETIEFEMKTEDNKVLVKASQLNGQQKYFEVEEKYLDCKRT